MVVFDGIYRISGTIIHRFRPFRSQQMVVYFPLHCFSAMGFNDSTIREMDTLLVSFVCDVFCKAKGVRTKDLIFHLLIYEFAYLLIHFLGIPAPSSLQSHPAAVGLVPGSASLPYFAALRLNKHLP